MADQDYSFAVKELNIGDQNFKYFSLKELENKGFKNVSSLPFSIKVLLEAALRQWDGKTVTTETQSCRSKTPTRSNRPLKNETNLERDFA